ncbi:hypothetical protein HZR84_10160 [Hyphobacterium sp. CCMP332]|nr:hypothetical protein HZR84_10160 [Hyphobacterium sp. CCMP332]
MKHLIALIILSSIIIISCDNDDDPVVVPETTTDLVLNFEFKVGTEALELGTGRYVLGNEDTVSIDQFKFILSNLTLRQSDGGKWIDEEGYYLVKASNGVTNFQLTIEDVPVGNYSSMEFHIGMDSAMNFKPESFPILFQQEGMYWDWNTGYKFLLLEGRYFSDSLSTPNNSTGLTAHIGDMINLEIPQFSFSDTLILESENAGRVNFNVDLGKIYTEPNVLSLKEANNRNIMGGPNALLIVENYGNGMIVITSIE